MTESDEWTIGRLLTFTTDYLKQHGSDSPRLDAEVLLAVARGCRRIDLYTAFDQVADDATRTAFRELVHRRSQGAPVAYLVGKREFFSLCFRVTPDVLDSAPRNRTAGGASDRSGERNQAKTGRNKHCRRWHRKWYYRDLRREASAASPSDSNR